MGARLPARILQRMTEFLPGFIQDRVPATLRPFLRLQNASTSSKLVIVANLHLTETKRPTLLYMETVGVDLQVAAAGSQFIDGTNWEEIEPAILSYLGPIIDERTRWPLAYVELNAPILGIESVEAEPAGVHTEELLVNLHVYDLSKNVHVRVARAIEAALRDCKYEVFPPVDEGSSRHEREFEV